MKKIFLFIVAIFFASQIKAQVNLVPNPSFELMDSCPTFYGEMSVKNWISFRGSTDYFNTCSNNYAGIPLNYGGFQHAYDGSAYCGIVTYASFQTNYREYLGCKLITPLTIGQKYFLHIKINAADSSRYSTNNMGMKLSTYSFFQQNLSPILNHAILFSSLNISDTLNWTKIDASFIADSFYQYIIIGNFFDDSHTTITDLGTGTHPTFDDGAYYYIDMVCLSTDSLLCNEPNGIYTLKTKKEVLNIFPNPTSEIIKVNLPIDNYSISITNSIGQILFHDDLIYTTEYLQDVSKLNDGIYFLTIQTSKSIQTNKFIKQSE